MPQRLVGQTRSRFAKTWIAGVAVALFVGSWVAKANLPQAGAKPDLASGEPPSRIVSMTPGITEALFALGLGERVVGVTRFCQFPEEATQLPQVGGHFDPNLEAILRLQPDLVVLLEEQRDLAESLDKLGMRSLAVGDNSTEQILDGIRTIGQRCGVAARAEVLAESLQRRMNVIRQHAAGRGKPTVLIVVSRSLDTGTIEDVYVVGRDDYFEALIDAAGGENAYRGPDVPYPVVSIEGIIRMTPDVIIDLAAGWAGERSAEVLGDWERFPQIDAVRHNRIYALTADYATIPGPRFVLLLEALAERIHAE